MGNCQKDEDEIRSVKVIPAKSYLYIYPNSDWSNVIPGRKIIKDYLTTNQKKSRRKS